MDQRIADNICVVRTDNLVHQGTTAKVLVAAGIPITSQQESPTGWRSPLPVHPDMTPGTYYLISVPREHAEAARALIHELPIPVSQLYRPAGQNISSQTKMILKIVILINSALAMGLLVYFLLQF